MLARVLLLMVLGPLVDLLLLLWIAQHTSAAFAFGLVIVGGVAGMAVLRWQGFRTLRHARREMQAGQMPAVALVDGLLISAAGLLLIVPGVLSDAIGLALLLPVVRRWVRTYARGRIEMRMFGARGGNWQAGQSNRDVIIDSRIVEPSAPQIGDGGSSRVEDPSKPK